MKSALVGLFLLLSSSVNANIFLPSCFNSIGGTSPVSYGYQSCINSNFRSIERAVEGSQFYSYCSNFGDEVSYSFTSCIQSNFRSVERALREHNIFLQSCYNFGRDRLDYSFTSCVNSNWRSVERALR